MEIRQLKVKDRKLVTGLFLKGIKELKDETIGGLIRSDAPQSEGSAEEEMGQAIITAGVSLLQKVVEVVDTDLTEWFADLIGVTVEEFDELPMNTEPDIFKAISEAPEAEAFFTLAWRNAKGTAWLSGALAKGRESLNSIIGSESESSTDTDIAK